MKMEQGGEGQGMGSSLKSTLTNLAYTLKNNCILQLPFSSRRPLAFTAHRARAHLLGRPYDAAREGDFHRAFEQIFWFSYRRLPKQCEDVGWGCMIRVLQMLLAQAVARDQPLAHPDALLDLFREEKRGPLSLGQICERGNIGERWTSCPELLAVASSILEELRESGRVAFTLEAYCDRLEIGPYEHYRPSDFPKLLVLHARLGTGETMAAPYLYHLSLLLQDRRFVGMASGQGSEALFVAGSFGELAIILDPHFVQEEECLRSFFPKNPQGVPFSELSSAATLGFYVPSLAEFAEFVGELAYGARVGGAHCCFELAGGEWCGGRKGSDDFQLL